MDTLFSIMKRHCAIGLLICVVVAATTAEGAAQTVAPQTSSAPAVNPVPFTLRVEQAAPFVAAPLKLDQPTKSLLREFLTGPVLSAIVSALTSAVVALIGVGMALRNTTATLYQKSNEAEVKELQTRLTEFYGPFDQISKENDLISREFRQRHSQGNDAFRTLISLLDQKWRDELDQSDRALLEKIIQNGKDLRELIRSKSGLVDTQIAPILAKAAAHFSVLEMAASGQLQNQPERFAAYVYPRELDPAIAREITRLNERIRVLLNEPGAQHAPISPLVLT